MNSFYMVYLEGCAHYEHETLESAEQEAKRLSTLFNKKVYILYTIKSIEDTSEDTSYKVEDCRPSG